MEIKIPKGKILVDSSTMQTTLKWNPNLEPRLNNQYAACGSLQKFIDNEYIRTVEPYWPLKTGALIKSMTLGTVVGSGTIHVIAPYARTQFYNGRTPGTSQTGALRGREPHERWKADNINTFMASVRRFAGVK